MKIILGLLLIVLAGTCRAEDRAATLSISDLVDYDQQPAAVKRLIARALELTTQNLSYKYGSCDPKEGGMDCSGTVYYLLLDAGIANPPGWA